MGAEVAGDIRTWTASVVRDGLPVGTAFLIDARSGLCVTCAHVLRRVGAEGGDDVRLYWHGSAGSSTRAVVDGHLLARGEDYDVAFLRVDAAPVGVTAPPLGMSATAVGHRFMTFGFTLGLPVVGLFAEGRVAGLVEGGEGRSLLQLAGATEIVPGFSGGPIYDRDSRRVIGMVAAIAHERHGRLRETAFGIPTETPREINPALLNTREAPYRGLAAFGEEDAEWFCGRGEEVDELVRRLRSDRRSSRCWARPAAASRR